MGVFSPLISIPFAGGVSYADQQEGEEIILIGFAAVSFLFSFANVYWLSFVSSIFISTDVVFTLVNFYSKMGSLVKNDPFAKQNSFCNFTEFWLRFPSVWIGDVIH
jgi:hypothetical protein